MFPLVKEHAGRRIERRPPGFEYSPGLLGKISSFVVPDGDGWAVFAFMYSFLVMGEAGADEDALAAAALGAIEHAIDGGRATAGSEHTFEWDGAGWRYVPDPRWWVSQIRLI